MPKGANQAGRPRKVIPVEDVFEAARNGYNVTQIAALLGVSRDTMEKRMKRPEYAAAYERGRGMAQGKVIDLIWKHAEENFKAVAFLANNLVGWSSTAKIETTEQARYVVELPPPLAPDEWTRIFGSMTPAEPEPAPPAPEPIAVPGTVVHRRPLRR